MRAYVLALIAVAACGRFDFDRHFGSPGDDANVVPDSFDPGATAADFVAAMGCETDIPIATVPQIDQLRWLDLGARQVVFAIYHVDNTHHELHAIVLGTNAGQIVVVDNLVEYAVSDLTGLVAARTPTGELVFIHDVPNNTVHAIALDASFTQLADTPLAGLEDSFEPYAKSDVAQMIAGVTPSGVVAYAVTDTGVMTGSTFVVDTNVDAPYRASIRPFGNDFIVGWTTGANTCRLVRLTAAGTTVAGPLTVAGPAGCTFASATAIGTSIFVTFEDPGNPAYAAVTDGALASISTPMPLGTSPSFIQQAIADVDHLVVAVSENSGDSRIVTVDTMGTVLALGADFGLTATDTDHQTASLVAGTLLHARSEGGKLHIRKLCR